MYAIESDPTCPPGGANGAQCYTVGGNPQSTTNFQFAACEFANSAQYDCAVISSSANECVSIPIYQCADCASIFNGVFECSGYCVCGGMSQGNTNFTPCSACT